MTDDERTKAMEFRKANSIITPRVARGGTLTLLSRKLLNVLLYHAQKLRQPGADAPDDDPLHAGFFWLPLRVLATDAHYNSEDMQVIRGALQRLQDIKIIVDDASRFSSDVLVPSIRIISHGRGRPVMVGWKFAAETERILLSPTFDYTTLSLYYGSVLQTTAGAGLYEIARRYLTNPSRLTAREPWEWWFDTLTGQPMSNRKPEYKFFKRDTLKPAMEEVNLTNLRVELIEHKEGRRVRDLQLRVTPAAQSNLELPPPPLINSRVLTRMTDYGIVATEAENLFVTHGEALVIQTLDWMRRRLENPKLPTVHSPAALLRSALRGRYALTEPEVAERKNTVDAIIPVVNEEDPERAERKRMAMIEFEAFSDDEKRLRMDEFSSTLKGHALRIFRSSGISHPLTRQAFLGWMVDSGAGSQ